MNDPSLCYLCGTPIGGVVPSMDHVPPKRLIPSAVRKTLKVSLLTLKTHPNCHKNWGKDEEYFFNTLLPHALNAPVGEHLAADFKKSLKHPGSKKLALQVAKQFQEAPSGVVLPGTTLVQKVDGARLQRVVWKIVRGLFHADNGQKTVLPDWKPRVIEIYGPMDPAPPAHVVVVMGEPSKGNVTEVLDYKVMKVDDPPSEFWNLLLWERYVIFVAFHAPSCSCKKCVMGEGPDA